MAWTSPPTYTGGQLIGASDMNVLRDNLLFLGGTTGVLPGMHASGGFTIDTGNLVVTAGVIGLGSVAGNIGIYIPSSVSINAAGGGAFGEQVSPTLVASANSDSLYGLEVGGTFNTNGKTGVTVYQTVLSGPTATGAVNAYTLFINAPTGASGANVALNVSGGGIVVGGGGITVTGSSLITGALTVTGGIGVAGGLTVTSSSLSVFGDMIGGGEVYGAAGTTGATTGFVRIGAAAGPPTGTVSSVSGRAAIYYDSSNNQIYVWNGVWKKTAVLT